MNFNRQVQVFGIMLIHCKIFLMKRSYFKQLIFEHVLNHSIFLAITLIIVSLCLAKSTNKKINCDMIHCCIQITIFITIFS